MTTEKKTGFTEQSKPVPAKAPIVVDRAKTMMNIINSTEVTERLKMLLNSQAMHERFIAIMTSTMNTTRNLKDCSEASILGALIKSAQTRLEPNTVLGRSWLIPRQNKGAWEAGWELGYMGAIELGMRSDIVRVVPNQVVFENDEFDIDFGTHHMTHKPKKNGDRGKAIGYWAKWIGRSPEQWDVRYMSDTEMQAFYSKYVKNKSQHGPWSTAFDEMAKKTVIKQVLKHAPRSTEDFAHAYAADGQVINANPDVAMQSDSALDILVGDMEGPEPLPADPELERQKQEMLNKVREKIDRKIAQGTSLDEIQVKVGIGVPLHDLQSLDIQALTVLYGDLG